MPETPDGTVHEATFAYRPDLVRAAYWRFTLRQQGAYLCGIAVSCLVGVALWLYDPDSVFAAAMASFFAGISLVYGSATFRSVRGIDADIAALPSPEVRLILDDGAFRVESSETCASYAWRKFRELHRFEAMWILCGKRTEALVYLDPAVLSSEARAFLEAKIREHRGQIN